jgi:hypothetical protein
VLPRGGGCCWAGGGGGRRGGLVCAAAACDCFKVLSVTALKQEGGWHHVAVRLVPGCRGARQDEQPGPMAPACVRVWWRRGCAVNRWHQRCVWGWLGLRRSSVCVILGTSVLQLLLYMLSRGVEATSSQGWLGAYVGAVAHSSP